MLNGELSVESELGKGSTFTITLPIEWPATAPIQEPIALGQPPEIPSERKTILLVDDEPQVLELFSEYLHEAGYHTITDSTGEEALRLAATHHPFAITLDIIMSGMDGWEVLQGLKKKPDTEDIPVIIISMAEDKETGFALGAVGYITKPLSRDVLLSEINRISRVGLRTVMVVDDNAIDRKELTRIIEGEGLLVLDADNGVKCLDMIKTSVPDVLILDLMMPGMDGFETLESVRSDPKTRNLPVIVVTAKDLTTEDKKRLSGNAASTLAKSDAILKDLLEEIKKLLYDIESSPKYGKPRDAAFGKRILLVEDNEAAVIQIKSMLESEGYILDVAHNGQEALDYVTHTIPHGIILDLMMPGVDGFEVLKKIRDTGETAKIPVLIITAKDLTSEDLQRLTADNIQQLIQKGDVDREGLLLKIKMMLGAEARVLTKPSPTTPRIPNLGAEPVKRMKVGGIPTVLIVEDNPDNMITIKAVLQDRYNILAATDGEEGLNTVLAEIPDLVLLDISLPKMDGYTVVRKMREKKDTRDIVVIGLSAHAMKGDKEKIMAEGCDDYMPKPLDPEELLRKIEEWLEREP